MLELRHELGSGTQGKNTDPTVWEKERKEITLDECESTLCYKLERQI